MAARRVAAFPNEINGADRPTAPDALIENKRENRGKSNEKSLLSRAIPDRIRRASKVLGFALFQNTSTSWRLTAEIWHLRLTRDERYSLGVTALAAVHADDMVEAVTAVLGGAGMPLPPFMEPLDDAQWWADLASPAELRAYAFAAFMALPPHEKRDFLEFVKGETA